MIGPWINNQSQQLVAALGNEQRDGPKLDMTMLVFAAAIIFLLGMLYVVVVPNSEVGVDLVNPICLAVLCLVLQHEYRPKAWQFGLSREVLRSKRTIVWMGAGLALAGANLAFIYGPGYFVSALGAPHATLTPGLRPFSHIVRQPLIPSIAVAVAPVLEELFFRGYLYLLFRQNWGRRRAALVSSAFFAAGHLGNVLVAFNVFFASLLDIYLDNKARSLAPSIAAHASYNLFLSVIRSTST